MTTVTQCADPLPAHLPDLTGRAAAVTTAVTGANSGLGLVTAVFSPSTVRWWSCRTQPGNEGRGGDHAHFALTNVHLPHVLAEPERGMRGAPAIAGRAARARYGSAARRLRKVPQEPTGTRFAP
ncbi:hypothetical protein [Streptomyces sp. SudanB66_2053]|uniref:hypothetical protein n=1 Tax=Streptomyces sp. SudanB66_2053 TaxID=3035277 RepID=UPI003F555DE0